MNWSMSLRRNPPEIHPEHLLDRLDAGKLSTHERTQLDVHLARCAACRFEVLVRSDLALENTSYVRVSDASVLLQF
jgi:anti-sigma factor RsiW